MPINFEQARALSHLELLAKQVVEGFITGLHKSPFHGFSVEFAEHRLYNTGESTRHIDWKLYGRSDKLFTKRYEEETNLRCQIVIDQSSSMYFPEQNTGRGHHSKVSFSVHAAAALIYLMKAQRDAVGLSLFDSTLAFHTKARNTPVHHSMLFSKLEALVDTPKATQGVVTGAASSIDLLAEQLPPRSLVILFSDMFDYATESLYTALQHLKYNKHEVILFHTIDKKFEEDFKFEDRPYEFKDVETGEVVKVHANQIRAHYQEKQHGLKQALQLKCAQYKINYVTADIGLGFEQVLMPYLIKRQHM